MSTLTDEQLDRMAAMGPGILSPEVWAQVERRRELKEKRLEAVGPAILASHPSTQHLVTEEQWDLLKASGIVRPNAAQPKRSHHKKPAA